MEIYRSVEAIHFKDAAEWRLWLSQNSAKKTGVWLIIYRKNGDIPSVQYDEALLQALCFGWIDSKINKRDSQSHYQYFSPRNPKSNWSKVNKLKVAQLLKENQMTDLGIQMVNLAKENGTWDALNDVEDLIPHPDMQTLLQENPTAANNWEAFPRSVRRGILEWIFNAKKPATRAQRIKETVEKAAQNVRANQYQKD
ncbi:MAG TPA: hypothetical protein DHW15_05280 [Bacteroidetes bacterium]|jgi:uncharacterized protein YdeI (YjbR/CyaY-like superfamily)|nr:MAG: hypothetical protein ABR95_09430 [Sphingobacteriales bacterium BACL12 MAG-120813-bin55]HCK21575.1 hypothetical protein [Bacteroidota bacterium]